MVTKIVLIIRKNVYSYSIIFKHIYSLWFSIVPLLKNHLSESLKKYGSYFSVIQNYIIIAYAYKMVYIKLNIFNIQLEYHIAFKGEKSHIQYDYYVYKKSYKII